MYIKRAAESAILKANGGFPVVLVTGPRQVGKTTLLKAMSANNRSFVTLDDPLERNLAKQDPKLFLSAHPIPVIIDEIQYAPELLPYIKIAVDGGIEAGSYWLTGSQAFDMMRNVTESLAGRVAVLNLSSMSNRELNSKPSSPFVPSFELITDTERSIDVFESSDLYRRIFIGGMPAIALNSKMDRDIFFSSYVSTYIERDIRSLINTGNEGAFFKFIVGIAARSGSILSLSDLSSDVGVSVPTAKSWLSLLESSGIVMLLEPYYNSLLKRLIKTPKIYMLDTGLCCYLTRWNSPETLERGAFSGSILESWVVSEIYKSYINAGKRPDLYYYRDTEKREIDLLIVNEDRIHPIEIKKATNPDKRDIRNFRLLENSGLTLSTGGVVCLNNKALPIDESNWIIPTSII